MHLLHNVIQINEYFIIFDLDAPRNILSNLDLKQLLIQAYNAPRNLANKDRLLVYTALPDFEHYHFALKTFRVLAKEVKEYIDYTISEKE